MMRRSPSSVVAPLLVLFLSAPLAAQPPASPPAAAATAPKLSLAEIRALAEAHVAIAVVLDSNGAQLAAVRNKTPQAQAETQKARAGLVAESITKRGMTVEEFDRRRYLVSTDNRLRFQFDSIVARITGQALPGTLAAAPPAVVLPAGLPGIGIGYVAANALDTPDKSGYLAMAVTEARVASQHAGFMARALDNLQTLQMHAGHILHAIDPSTIPAATAPGKGFGVKRALEAAVTYTDFAAKSTGVSLNIKTHAVHIMGATRSASLRADQIIVVARKIQSATTVAAAAALVGQLTSLCNELVAGTDVNADGRIVWGDGEGGIQQAQDHMKLLLAGEPKP